MDASCRVPATSAPLTVGRSTMEKIAHRELRNNCGWLWARVAAGESFEITVDDVVTAVVSPPQVTPLERLIEDGAVREARHRSLQSRVCRALQM